MRRRKRIETPQEFHSSLIGILCILCSLSSFPKCLPQVFFAQTPKRQVMSQEVCKNYRKTILFQVDILFIFCSLSGFPKCVLQVAFLKLKHICAFTCPLFYKTNNSELGGNQDSTIPVSWENRHIKRRGLFFRNFF